MKPKLDHKDSTSSASIDVGDFPFVYSNAKTDHQMIHNSVESQDSSFHRHRHRKRFPRWFIKAIRRGQKVGCIFNQINSMMTKFTITTPRRYIEEAVGHASSTISNVTQIPKLMIRELNHELMQHDSSFLHDSQVSDATNIDVEQFLSNIVKERPIRFTPLQLSQSTESFSKVLGSGGFGVVYKGKFPNGMQIAVKVLNNTSSNRAAEQFMAEIGTIGRTYHKNLVRLYGFCFDDTMRALVYEYLEFGSLDKLLFSENKSSADFGKLYEISIGIAKGIAYLHEECEKRIIHYDIKPGNILLDENLKPKVADFGLAMLCNQDTTHVALSGCRGTPGYAAPEMWAPYAVTHKCDVYSFGMLLFEIVGRRRNHDPNLSGNSKEWLPKWAYQKFVRNELFEMLHVCDIKEKEKEKATRLIMVALWCVQYVPKTRPMMSSVVKMLLEDGDEIHTPPNPFAHLEELLMEFESSTNNSKWTTSTESNNGHSSATQ